MKIPPGKAVIVTDEGEFVVGDTPNERALLMCVADAQGRIDRMTQIVAELDRLHKKGDVTIDKIKRDIGWLLVVAAAAGVVIGVCVTRLVQG